MYVLYENQQAIDLLFPTLKNTIRESHIELECVFCIYYSVIRISTVSKSLVKRWVGWWSCSNVQGQFDIHPTHQSQFFFFFKINIDFNLKFVPASERHRRWGDGKRWRVREIIYIYIEICWIINPDVYIFAYVCVFVRL